MRRYKCIGGYQHQAREVYGVACRGLLLQHAMLSRLDRATRDDGFAKSGVHFENR